MLVDAATQARLDAGDGPRRLTVAELAPGAWGVLEARVARAGTVRPYRRKQGGEGLLGRVTLADPTGEVELVLWDDETRLLREPHLQPGARLLVQGATVKAGYRGGLELALGAGRLEPVAADAPPAARDLTGILVRLDPRGETVDLVLAGADPAMAVLPAPLAAGLAVPMRVRVAGVVPHPLLDGWFQATAGTRVERL